MRPVAAEVVVVVATTAVMVGFVLTLGTVLARPPVQPGDWTAGEMQACHEAPLTAVSESGVEGAVRLCVDREGTRPVIQVRGLQQGEAYSAWLAYFDQPSDCFAIPCGFLDLRGDDPVGVLGRVDGAVAPPTGHLELGAVFRDLKLAHGSQISLLVLSQGATSEADGRTRARQNLTPRMFELGAPMAGALADRVRGLLHAQAVFTIE